MADTTPRVDPPPRPNWGHDWLAYERYLGVHLSYMRTLERDGVVERDNLSIIDIRRSDGRRSGVHMYGRVWCAHGVIVEVDKWLAVDLGRSEGGDRVRGEDYSYHAYVERASGPVALFRYDNSDGHGGLHRHTFDLSGTEVQVDLLSLEELPTLDLILRQAAHRGANSLAQWP